MVAKTCRVIFVFLIALTLLGSGVAWGVLCVGADGHVAFETAHHDGCHGGNDDHPVHKDNDHNDDMAGIAFQGCLPSGSCIDLSFSSETIFRSQCKVRCGQSGKHLFRQALSCALMDVFSRRPIERPAGPTALCLCSRVSPQLSMQRTVILQI
jgi:hypothetical protein